MYKRKCALPNPYRIKTLFEKQCKFQADLSISEQTLRKGIQRFERGFRTILSTTDPYTLRPDSMSEFHIGRTVPYHNRTCKIYIGEIRPSLQRHTDIGFPVRIPIVDRRTDVYPVDPSSSLSNFLQHFVMNRLKVLFGHHTSPDPALVRHHDDVPKPRGQHAQCLDTAGYKFELLPSLDIILRTKPIDHPALRNRSRSYIRKSVG